MTVRKITILTIIIIYNLRLELQIHIIWHKGEMQNIGKMGCKDTQKTYTQKTEPQEKELWKKVIEQKVWEKVTPSSRKNAQMNGKSLGMARRICNKFGIGLVPRRETSLSMGEGRWELLKTWDYDPQMRFETMR